MAADEAAADEASAEDPAEKDAVNTTKPEAASEPEVAYPSSSSEHFVPSTASPDEATASSDLRQVLCSNSNPSSPSGRSSLPSKMQTLSEMQATQALSKPRPAPLGEAVLGPKTLREVLDIRLGELKERLLIDLEHLVQDSKGFPQVAALPNKSALSDLRHDSRESLGSVASTLQVPLSPSGPPSASPSLARGRDMSGAASNKSLASATSSKLGAPGHHKHVMPGIPTSRGRSDDSLNSSAKAAADARAKSWESNAASAPTSFRTRLKSIFTKTPLKEDIIKVAAEVDLVLEKRQSNDSLSEHPMEQTSSSISQQTAQTVITNVSCLPQTPNTSTPSSKGRSMVSFMFGRNMNEPEVKGGYKPVSSSSRAVRAHAPALVRARTCETSVTDSSTEITDHSPRPSVVQEEEESAIQPKTVGFSKQGATEFRSSIDGAGFEVAPVWRRNVGRQSSYKKGSKVKGFGTGLTKNLDIYNLDEVDPEDVAHNALRQCFYRVSVQQMSRKRIFWDFLGFLMVSYDFIMIPLQLFEIEEGTAQMVSSNVARIYWTLDIFMSFITTQVLPSGKMVNNFRDIAKSYVNSWFLFDLSIVTFDWIDWIMAGQTVTEAEGTDGSTDFIRSMRVLRIVRMLRLVRLLLNAPEMTRFVVQYFRSEKVMVVLGVIKIMVFVVGLTHIMACGWYGVGKGSGGQGWVVTEELRDGSLGARYASAFYWSVAQFTGASSQIPQSTSERVYGIIVQLVAFVNSVSIVSSLTTLMTRLQLITAQSTTQLSVLRRYLMDNRISSKIATRVLRNANHVIEELKRNTPESDVELMSLISHPLRVELRYEVHWPTLTQHPFFFCYNKTNPAAMRQCCYNAIGKLQVSKGDVLFSPGEVQEESDMFFVLKGLLKHSRECQASPKQCKKAQERERGSTSTTTGGDTQLVELAVPEGCWLHEAALWTDAWTFTGMVRASSECGLLCIKKQIFQHVASQYRTTEFYPAQYAAAFVEELNLVAPDQITEISEMIIDIEHLVGGVFPVEVNSMYQNRKRVANSKLSSFLRRSDKRPFAKSKIVPAGEMETLDDVAEPPRRMTERKSIAPGSLAYLEEIPSDEEVQETGCESHTGDKEPYSEFTVIAP